mmetsp:Transcript_139545/g.253826  ORF Transcript_139545/g.253826 Transcript_139545/m.253826 type:complete len:571 (-) Transcript_139545:66-1778(-)
MMWQAGSQRSFSLTGKSAELCAPASLEASVTKAALLVALVGTSFGGLGYFCGSRLRSQGFAAHGLSGLTTDISDIVWPQRHQRFEDAPSPSEIEAIGSPLVEGSKPLWAMSYAHSHGAKDQDLGVSMLYYTLAYIQKPATCVVIGASSGFVPALIRRGQAASGMTSGRTYVIDLGYGDDASQSVHDADSDFRRAFPEIEVLVIPSVPDGVAHFRDRSVQIDYLHIEGNNTFDHQGAYRDLVAYQHLLASNAVVTIHVTSAADSANHSGAYHLVEGLKRDPCWEVTDFKPPELPSAGRKWSRYGAGTAVLKHRCQAGRRQVVDRPRTCQADERLMMPDCRFCVPGVKQHKIGVCEDWISPKLQYLRQRLSDLHVDWRHRGIEFSPLRDKLIERQVYASVYLQRTRPRRVLDLLSGKLTLENFVDFGSAWCPELILSVDISLSPKFQTIECAHGAGEVKIIHAAMLAMDALEHSWIHETAFDAVLCLGCDRTFDGPRAMHLESFARPYDLILEWANELENSRAAYADIPRSAQAITIFKQDWFHEDPTAEDNPHKLQNTSRQFRVIRYPAFA